MGILAQLQRGELDAALLVPPASGVPGIAMTPLGRERLALAVPAGHRLAGRRSAALAELDGDTLVALAHSDSPGFAAEIAAACQRAGFHPRVMQESSHALVTLPLIAAGLGWPSCRRHCAGSPSTMWRSSIWRTPPASR